MVEIAKRQNRSALINYKINALSRILLALNDTVDRIKTGFEPVSSNHLKPVFIIDICDHCVY